MTRFSERYRALGAWKRELRADWDIKLIPLAIPQDVLDGFYGAYWRWQAAYLDAEVRAGISIFAALSAADVDRDVSALAGDNRVRRMARQTWPSPRTPRPAPRPYVAAAELG